MLKQLLRKKARQFIDCHVLPEWTALIEVLGTTTAEQYDVFCEKLMPSVEQAMTSPKGEVFSSRLLDSTSFTQSEREDLSQVLKEMIRAHYSKPSASLDLSAFQKWLDTFEGYSNPNGIRRLETLDMEMSNATVSRTKDKVTGATNPVLPSFSSIGEQVYFDALLAGHLDALYKQPANESRHDADLFQEALRQTQKKWQRFSLFGENCRVQQKRVIDHTTDRMERPLPGIS